MTTIDLTKQEWVFIPGFSSDFTNLDFPELKNYLQNSLIPHKTIASFPIFISNEIQSFQKDNASKKAGDTESATLITEISIPSEKIESLHNTKAYGNDYFLVFSGIGENYIIYWNGIKIHESVYLDSETKIITRRRSLKNLIIPIDRKTILEHNTLAVTVSGTASGLSFYHNPEFGFFYRGNYYLSNNHELIKKIQFNFSDYAFFIFIFAALFFLALFAANRNETSNIAFALLVSIFAAYSLSQNRLLTFWFPEIDTSILILIELITLSIIPLVSFRFILLYFDRKIHRNSILWYLNIFHWAIPLTAVALPYYLIHHFIAVVIIYYIPFLILLGAQAIPDTKQGKAKGKLMVIVLSSFLIFLLIHIYDYLVLRSGYNLTIIGFLLVIIFIAYSYSLKYRYALNKNKILNQHFQRINTVYQRFVPKQFLNYLDRKDILEVKLGDQIEREMTILFSDIRGFTKLSYEISEEDTFNLINDYLSYIVPVIQKNNGFIDKFIGDAVMALFPDSPQNAVNAAIEMHRELDRFNRQSKIKLNIGIGVHTGNLRLGIIGHDERMETTVISDAVNLAAKIESLTKTFSSRLLISGNTFFELDDPSEFHFRILTRTMVKGNDFPVGILEIFNNDDPVMLEKKLQTKTAFETAFSSYANRDFEKACELFSNLKDLFPEDKAILYFLDKIKYYKKNPPPESWSGIEIVTG